MNYTNLIPNAFYSKENQIKIFELMKNIRYYTRYSSKGGEKVKLAKNFIIENLNNILNDYLVKPYDFSDFGNTNNNALLNMCTKGDFVLKRALMNTVYNNQYNNYNLEYIKERKCYKVFIDKSVLKSIPEEIKDENFNDKTNLTKVFTEEEILKLMKQKKLVIAFLERSLQFLKYSHENDINLYDKNASKEWDDSEKYVLDFSSKKNVAFYEKLYPQIFNAYLKFVSDDFNRLYKDMVNNADAEIKNKYIKTKKQSSDNSLNLCM